MNECENSIKFYGIIIEEYYIYLIMELCDCNLAQIINEKKGNIEEIKEILTQLNNVFKIMYRNNIIHKDIKPENILIKKLENDKYLYKLTDYNSLKFKGSQNDSNIEKIDYIAQK